MSAIERLRQTFVEEFGTQPEVVARAPGRVNLIGEHTDYNDGFVLPVAIDREVAVAARRRSDSTVSLVAANFGRRAEFTLEEASQPTRERWSHYERGVALMLMEAGHRLGGFEAVISGDVPSSAGLSSSAAVEVATATALKALFELDLDPVRLALLCQRAENQVVGVNCGIMDQFIAALGKRDHALFLDCRSLETRHVPLRGAAGDDAGVQILVADTAVKRGLVDSEYNRRRAECDEAVRLLGERLPGVRALRDVSLAQFEAHAAALPEVVRRRARHVISENERVQASVEALSAGDLVTFGRLMDESHTSLHRDYEVTVPELDAMVEAARAVPGVYGARMTGAGFGGCTVSLVRAEAVPQFMNEVPERYRARTGLVPKLYVCRAMDGASLV
ncbi:MAG TPA: galactokinase [Chloroflexota bacterium]|nr:galactokinase [Chloroflexota bacterium]